MQSFHPAVFEGLNDGVFAYSAMDELFKPNGTAGVVSVVGGISSLDCDLERLEGESDRVGKYARHSVKPREHLA